MKISARRGYGMAGIGIGRLTLGLFTKKVDEVFTLRTLGPVWDAEWTSREFNLLVGFAAGRRVFGAVLLWERRR